MASAAQGSGGNQVHDTAGFSENTSNNLTPLRRQTADSKRQSDKAKQQQRQSGIYAQELAQSSSSWKTGLEAAAPQSDAHW
jgi:hypothetical protein